MPDRLVREQHDRELVFRIVAGEGAAFAELYRCYSGIVQAVTRSYVRDPDAVADLVQEVFVHALARLHTLRKPDRFRSWLLAIARHAAIDHRRAGAPGRFVALDAVAPPEEPRPGPAEAAHRRQTLRLFRECFDQLSKRDAAALSLVAQAGLGPAEVAAALGVKIGAAKVILHRARQRYRAALLVEFFVRQKVRGCERLEEIRLGDDGAAVIRHVRACEACSALARPVTRLAW